MSEHRSVGDYDDDGGDSSNNSDAAGGPAVPRGAVGYSSARHDRSRSRTATVDSRTSSGAGGRGRGWEGDDLERDRDREHRGQVGSGGTSKKAVAAAVDLEQFRNYQVGTGYQARHVVRQRTAVVGTEHDLSVVRGVGNRHGGGLTESSKSAVLGTTRGTPRGHEKDAGSDEEELRPSRASRKEKRKRKASIDKEKGEDDSVRAYLECDAFRVFRKELESMLKDS